MFLNLLYKQKVLEKESLIIAVFIFFSIFNTLLRPYLLMIFLLLIGLYLISKDIVKSVWLGFLVIMLFYRAKYFVKPIEINDFEAIITYFVEFSDGLLILLLYLIARKRIILERNKVKSNSFLNIEILSFLIITLGIISSWFSKMSGVAWFSLLQLIKYFVIYYLGRIILINRKIKKVTIEVIFLFVLFNGLLIILQKINGGPLGLSIESINRFSTYGLFAAESISLYRPGGITTSPNLLASIFGMIIPMLFVLGLTKNKFNKVFVWLCLVSSVLALIFTLSRAIWILVGIMLPVIYLWLKKKKQLQAPILIKKYGKKVGFLLIMLLIPFMLDRLISLKEAFGSYGTGIYRVRHLLMAKDFMLKNSFGIGLNVFQYEIIDQYEPEYFFYDSSPAHNLIAQVGAGMGMVGVVLFLWLFWKIFKKHLVDFVRTRYNPLHQGIILAVISYILILQIHPWLLKRPIAGLFWILAGFNYEKEI